MTPATIDHILWGVPELNAGIEDIERRTGVRAAIGGRHPGVGTHNALLDLGERRYLEIIAPDPTQDRFSSFGLLLKDLKSSRLITWAARTDDVEAVSRSAHSAGLQPREIRSMSRERSDGTVLKWRLMEIGGHEFGPLIPFFIEWGGEAHPSESAPRGLRLTDFEIGAPDENRLAELLGALSLSTTVRASQEQRLSATLNSPTGPVQL